MSRFEIYKDKRGEFRFRLKSGNGQTILASEGYTRKEGCTNGIRSVKNNAIWDNKYVRKNSSNGMNYFVLLASNGQVIGMSELYSSRAGLENGIYAVKKNAPISEVVDLSL